jgi:hypothetical protein
MQYTHGGREIPYRILLGRHVNHRIILKLILYKYGIKVFSGLKWLRIGYIQWALVNKEINLWLI